MKRFFVILFLLGLSGYDMAIAGLSVTPRKETWVADGPVWALARAGNIAYLGGDFNWVGPFTGHGVSISTSDGQPISPFPEIPDMVSSVASDLMGGWYVGTLSLDPDIQDRFRVIHILADGKIDPLWHTSFNETVDAISVSPDGKTVCVGGEFTIANGLERWGLASFSAETGMLTNWAPRVFGPLATVYAIAFSPDGKTVYAGGLFFGVNGENRWNLAAIDQSTGIVSSWHPELNISGGSGGAIYSLAISADGKTIYVGGGIHSIHGIFAGSLFAIDTVTARATLFDAKAVNTVFSIVLSPDGKTLYAGGDFSSLGGMPRRCIGAVDATFGAVTDWDPGADEKVRALAVSADGEIIYAGGEFKKIGNQSRYRLAAINAATGVPTSWNPKANSMVLDIALFHKEEAVENSEPRVTETVFAGGHFSIVGGSPCRSLAAIDTIAGKSVVLEADANSTGIISALAVSPDNKTLYLGGRFESIGGYPRKHLASIDIASGKPANLNPIVGDVTNSYPVQALAISPDGSMLYVGGNLQKISDQSRMHIAAINTGTGVLSHWNPSASGPVNTLLASPDGNTIYVGGSFSSIGGKSRSNIAALSAASSAATDWSPNANKPVFALGLSQDSNIIYAGGEFTSINSQSRNYIAALDVASGNATAWAPALEARGLPPRVSALLISSDGGTVYAGGSAIGVSGRLHGSLVAISRTTGMFLPWDPDMRDVSCLMGLSNGSVCAGGSADPIQPWFRHNFAQFEEYNTAESWLSFE